MQIQKLSTAYGVNTLKNTLERLNIHQASPEQIFELKKQLKIKLTEHNIPEFTNNHFEQQATSQQNEIENSPPNTIDPTTPIEPLATAAITETPIPENKLTT